MKKRESKYNPAVKELSDYIHKHAEDGDIHPDMFAKITRVLDGVEVTDNLLVQKDSIINQKTTELQSKENLLAQKEQLLIQKDKNLETLKESGVVGEQKEFVDALHKLYPKWYPEKLEDWSSDTWGKQLIDKGDYKTIQANLPAYRQQVLEKEFIDILHELYPSWYPVNFKDWPADSWGKGVVDRKDYKAIEGNLPIYKQWLANKKELIEILPKLHPGSYPVKYEEWTNQYAKGLLDKGDYKTIEQSLPIYRKQLAKKEFIEILPKLYPTNYPVGFENWTYQWGKGVVDRDEFETIKKNLPNYKKLLLQKEFIDSMHQVNPNVYPAKFEDWSNKSLGKEIIEKEDYKAMEQSLSDNRQKLKEMEKEKLLSQKENELKKLAGKDQLLNDREQEIAKIKELLSIKELEAQNKDQLLLAKELEKQELARQKEIEKEELLAQKEKEIHNKSLVKNQVIGELQGDIDFKEKEAYKLQIKLLKKQLEFKDKEVELKDKALEDALEIGKQNKIINELQGKLLAVVDLHKEGKDIPDIEVLKSQVNESILSGNVDDMKEFSKYLSQLIKNPIEKDESLEISELLNNLSPVLHVQENLVQNPLAVINNFDINNIHTTQSILVSMSGEGAESFEII
jgi:hypothetical protein